MKTTLEIKRIYDDYKASDGYRVLVDRLWPRGVSKEKARLDEWNKDIAPSPGARTHFNHEDDKWEWFKKAYTTELQKNTAAIKEFKDHIKGKAKVTLLYGAKSPEHNHAVILRDFLKKKL